MIAIGEAAPAPAPLSWLGIVRLGLVQTAIGAIFVLATSTLNRVMVIELALPAVLPGALIALHYATQILRPRLGHGSDVGGRRTPWIVGGMAILALGGLMAAIATALMRASVAVGIAMAIPAFVLIGLGVGASGTALLVLIAKRTAPARRPAAATIAWVMMIVGFIVTAGVAGRLLDPFSPTRLVVVAAAISGIGLIVTGLAVWGIEGRATPATAGVVVPGQQTFGQALREVWAEAKARRFAIFIFVSMLAYGGEDLMIEPFAGALFAMTPGETAKLSGVLHAGALLGMISVAIIATSLGRRRIGSLQTWMTGGCIGSAAALIGLAALGIDGQRHALAPTLLVLGAANGAYAIAAIASMMQRVGADRESGAPSKEGTRMGVWGAAQACAFGGGGLAATTLSDAARHVFALQHVIAWQPAAYASVFAIQAVVFFYAAVLATRLDGEIATPARSPLLARP